jgi:hypothetical protein
MKNISAVIIVFCKETRIKPLQFAKDIIQSGGFRDWRTGLLLGAVLLSLSVAPVARAQTGSENTSLFGTFGQLNAGVTVLNGILIGTNACVPTATVNGLTFLENYQLSISQPDPLTFSPTYTSVNFLATAMNTQNNSYYVYTNAAGNYSGYYSVNAPNNAAAALSNGVGYYVLANRGGTPTTSMFNGLQSYLSPTGNNPAPTVSISGQIAAATPTNWLSGTFSNGMNIALNTTPTAGFLANALNTNAAVELTFEWGVFNTNGAWVSLGGHEVTLESISMTNTAGAMQYLDPWGSSAVQTLGTVTNIGGYLYVTDTTTNIPFDYLEDTNDVYDPYDTNNIVTLEPGDGSSLLGRVDVAMIESVPEPSPCSLAVVALSIIFGRKIRRKWRAS